MINLMDKEEKLKAQEKELALREKELELKAREIALQAKKKKLFTEMEQDKTKIMWGDHHKGSDLTKEKVDQYHGKKWTGLLKRVGKAFAILLAVGVLYGIITEILHRSNDENNGGDVRNCIRSALGNPPECSDYDGVRKPTYVNGKYVEDLVECDDPKCYSP